MEYGLKRMSPRAKAVLQLGSVVAGGILLLGSCSYVVNSSQEVNEYLISRNPAMYIRGVADFLEAKSAESSQYNAELSELVRSANSVPSLAEADRLYLFESNASLVDAGKAIGICESQVASRLDEKAKLDYVLTSVDSTESRFYLQIVGQMIKNVGEDAYNSLAGLFSK
jgi:hypothetical protein